MAEWDFESALNDYFGGGSSGDGRPTTEDSDAPLGVAGSATFSAPSGWDFDKALNDYFNGVNGYVAPSRYFAPRGYEFSDAGSIGALEDFGLRHRGFVPPAPPPTPPLPTVTPTPSSTPPAGGVTPEDFGLRHRGFIPPPPPPTPTLTPTLTPTPTQTPSMPGQQPAQAQGGFEAWLDKFNDISKLLASLPGRLGDIALPGGWRRPVTLPSQADITGWLTEFIPTEEEIAAIEGRKGGAFPYLGRQAGRLIGAAGRSNELARQYVPGVGGEEDLPLYVPLGIPYDLTEDLRANYPGIEPWVYPFIADIHTGVRPDWLMPHAYGGEGRATGFTFPSPLNSITLASEPGKPPSPSIALHEAAHAIAFRDFGRVAPLAWEGPLREPQRRFAPGWDPFIDAIQSYQGNPSAQFAAINKQLADELTNKKSYLNTNPMEAYARIAELSGGDLRRMPPEFRKFYTWLGRKERVREPP